MNLLIITAVTSAALSFAAGWQLQGVRLDHLKGEYANEQLSRERDGRQALADATAAVTAAQSEAKVATDRVLRDAASAAASDNGVRSALATAVRAASTDLQACTGQVATISELLTASTDLSRRIAAEADDISWRLTLYQNAWPSGASK